MPTLYEDDVLLAVEKPAGLDIGGDEGGTSGLLDLLKTVREPTTGWHPVNRLSRYESGVLILAKDTATAEFLRTGLREQSVEQTYVAVVHGRTRDRTTLIGADRGASHGKGRQRWKRGPRAAAPQNPRTPTRLDLLYEGRKRSIVRCVCRVRTTHALRAQLRSLDLRLLGDRLHDRSPRPDPHHLTCLHLVRIVFHHPVRRRRTVVSCDSPPFFRDIADGARDLNRPLHAALIRRLPLLTTRETDAYRLLTGAVEDLPGVSAERFGPVVILQVYAENPAVESAIEPMARWYRDVLDVSSVYMKRFVRNRTAADSEMLDALHAPTPLLGRPAPERFTIQEKGMQFEVRPHGGFSVGLFPDHRDNRAFVRSISAGKNVLNLFAYTCGFSVAAAAGGARSVVSVDLSPPHLEWGKTNFALNHFDADAHVFVAEDAVDYLRRASKRGPAFDLVLIDPPTFAHGRKGGRDFSITRDLHETISLAAAVLRPAGVLMLSTNCRTLTRTAIRQEIRRATAGRRVTFLASPELPCDYAVDPDHVKTVFAQLT